MKHLRLKLFLLLFTALLVSCRQQKELIYFNGLGAEDIQNQTTIDQESYCIRANDILYIKVLTLDEKINMMFNQASGTNQSVGGGNQMYGEETLYFTGFSVRDDGNVEIPMIGLVNVKGKTIDEAKAIIEKKALEQLKEPIVQVKLGSFKVTMLGEVRQPGVKFFYNKRPNIIEAIGKSGDLTDYGNRQQVLIIRPTVNGSRSYRINLQDKKLLNSPEFYIQPNDVIYVPPLKAKGINMVAQDYGVLISILSSTLATVSIVITLILNLKK
jgi:polysaccharide export outer membrane protein